MDKLLKCSQLAKALGLSNASIAMAIKNNKLIRENKKINIEAPVNKIWIESQINLGKSFDLNKIYKPNNIIDKKEVVQTEPETEEEKDQPKKVITADDIRKLELQIKAANLKKTKKETIKLELQIKKIEGQLIPYDAIKDVFLYSAETFRTTYLQEVEGLATKFMAQLGGDHKHFVELQKELTEKIDDIQKTVKENLLQGLKGIVAEYREVKGRGERQ